jgi:hypothetical protein
MAGKVAPFEETVTGTKTEEEAAGCPAGEKAADAVLVGIVAEEEKPAAAADDDEEIMYVMSQEQVDYILSWDLEEDKFHRYDDDSDAWNKACDFFRKAQLDQLQYQKKVREEYEAYGYVRVEYDEDEERKMSETHRAAFLPRLPSGLDGPSASCRAVFLTVVFNPTFIERWLQNYISSGHVD